MNGGGGIANSFLATLNIASCSGDSSQAGSVAVASPARAIAWQRQPPKSTSFSAQDRQGSGIQSVPRKAWKAGTLLPDLSAAAGRGPIGEFEARDRGRRMAGQDLALSGSTFRMTLPQPPMQGFGRLAQ